MTATERGGGEGEEGREEGERVKGVNETWERWACAGISQQTRPLRGERPLQDRV